MAGPVLPAEYYGTVTINGDPAPAGTVITALINSQVAGTITTTASGTYGGAGTFDPRLVVEGTESGQAIEFRIDGRTAGEASTFRSGSTSQVALSVQYSPGSSPVTTTAAPTATVTSPVAPGPDQALENPWTPSSTAASVPSLIPTRPTSAFPQITPRGTPGAQPVATTSFVPASPAVTPTEIETTEELPASEELPPTTPASPGLSFETMALLGLLIIIGVVIRK